MQKPTCLYCRKPELERTFDRYPDTKRYCHYKCRCCGIICTREDLELNAKYRSAPNPDSEADSAGRKAEEEKALNDALLLMQNREWEKATEVLYRQSSPLNHPPEFLVLRNICQASALLLCDKADLPTRYRKLDILLNNIQNLAYYLPGNDLEAESAAFQRIFAALMLFGSLPIRRHAHYVLFEPIYYTNQKRSAVLSSFADFLELETIGRIKYCADYQKMAVQLFHKCLELAEEKNSGLFPWHFEYHLNLPHSERRQINQRIRQLNTELRQRDPDFIPTNPLPVPKTIPQGVCKAIQAAAVFGLCYMVLFGVMKIQTTGPTDAYNLFIVSGTFALLITVPLLQGIKMRRQHQQKHLVLII